MSKLARVAALLVVITSALTTTLASHAKTEAPRAVTPIRTVEHAAASHDDAKRGIHSAEPVTLRAEGAEVLAFAPAKASVRAAKPRTVLYLHGAHGNPGNGCPWMRAGAADVGWLVCPEGVVAEPNAAWSWGADLFAQKEVIDRATRAAVREGASSEPAIAVGFSQGSYVVLDLLKTRLATFRALVLLGADVHPNVDRLRAAGVTRVALGAGSRDAAYASMREEAVRLADEGLETRFFDLGRVGHTYAAEDKDTLTAAISWAAAAP